MATMMIDTSKIVCDPTYQVRRKLDESTINRYVEVLKSENKMPPIKLAVVNDLPILIDGWHRLEAMRRLSIRVAEAELVRTNKKEAKWLAAQANMMHGLPLKRAELREVFRAYIRAKRHKRGHSDYKSYRDMQKDLSIPYTTIRQWMFKDFPATAKRIGGNDEFTGKGGLQEIDPVPALEAQAMDSIGRVWDAFRNTDDANLRGTIVERMAEVLDNMKRAGRWNPSEF